MKGRAGPAVIPEKYLRCLWYDQRRFLKRAIRTRDGKRISIISPGAWNTGRGPDFFDGVFRVARGGTVRGDVEVHRRRRDWRAHGHRRDPAFSGVRLHVFLQDDGKSDRCESHSGGRLTEICLRGQTRRGPGSSARAIDPRDYPYRAGAARGRCGPAARKAGHRAVARFLRAAGEARLREKSRRAGSLILRLGGEQALYRLILETLGYSAHKDGFIGLAGLLPWEGLRRIALGEAGGGGARAVEAALMGAAGLIPAAASPAWDDETVRAWEDTALAWRGIDASLRIGALPEGSWKGGPRRPAASPCRRIAGVAPLLAALAGGGLESLLAGVHAGDEAGLLEERLADALGGDAPSYWRTRCAWGGAKLGAPIAPIGRDHRLKIVVNALLPFLHAKGRRKAAEGILRGIPAVEPDSRVKTMMANLVGWGAPFPGRWGMAAQQGMLHIHRRFCAGDRTGCIHCPIPGMLARRAR